MAWHNSGVGNGGGPGGNGEGTNGGQPLGTEYTLQGVMRFLQSEWHRHERDRNAWEIERAEMKSRIGKMEGDGRTSKRLQESLGKHVKMLEGALKKEREKRKKAEVEGKVAEKQTEGAPAKEETKADSTSLPSKPPKTALDAETDDAAHAEIKQDNERDKSRLYLGKCVQEVTYHVVPSTAAQQSLVEEEQALQNHQYPSQMSQQSLEEMYAQQHRSKQQPNHTGAAPAPSIPNHQPAPALRNADPSAALARSQQSEQNAFLGRNHPDNHILNQASHVAPLDARNATRQNYGFPSVPEDGIEKVSHNYDAYGQPIPSQDEETNIHVSQEHSVNDVGQWNFEVESEQDNREPPPDYPSQHRPDTNSYPAHHAPPKSPPRGSAARRKNSLSKRRPSDGSHELRELSLSQGSSSTKGESSTFKVRFALRGHLDVVRSVIFTGGGTPAEPEICTTGDDGVIKRWIIPASYSAFGTHGSSAHDLDISSYFTHRGHTSSVMCLASAPASPNFLNGGRALGDGWVFSGGQDATVRVWERGRVDPKATLDGHTDAVWTVCVLPASSASILGDQSTRHGGSERMLLASGAADGTIIIWAVSSPPQLTSPQSGSRRGAGGSRRANSISSGSNFPSSPQPSTATAIPFHHSLVHRIERVGSPSPTCITPLSPSGENFVVSYADASVIIYDTRTKEEIIGMASQETYDGTLATSINAVAATTAGLEGADAGGHRGSGDEDSMAHGATGSSAVEGMVLSGHEDRFIRFFDANSGQCTYTMLAHPAAISALSLSPDGRELVSAGHDASLRFWSLEKRSCVQEIASHRPMRGEGVCAVQWSADGRWVLSGGGDGVVKVWTR